MGKHKLDGKAKGKGSQLVIRIDKAEREAFVTLCEKLDTSAAREIRRFMRGFVAAHADRQAGAGDAGLALAAQAPPVAAPESAVSVAPSDALVPQPAPGKTNDASV